LSVPGTSIGRRAPGSGCSAIGGLNHNHAILGTSDACIATHPSDMAVAMRALDATVETVATDGTARSILIADFHTLPGETPHVETILAPEELITTVTLPTPRGGVHLYRKVRERASYAFANVSVALIATVERGRVTVDRLAFGGLAQALACGGGGARLRRRRRCHDDPIADVVLAGATPTEQNAYKLALVRRTLLPRSRTPAKKEATDDRPRHQSHRRTLKVTGHALYSYERQRRGSRSTASSAAQGSARAASSASTPPRPSQLRRGAGVDASQCASARTIRQQANDLRSSASAADEQHDRILRRARGVRGRRDLRTGAAAAALVKLDYAREAGAFDLASHADKAEPQETLSIGLPGETRFGDIDRAMAESPVTIDQTYDTPYHFSQPMEPHACLVDWRDNHLTVYLALPDGGTEPGALADTLLLDEDQVTVDAACGRRLRLQALCAR
jgi:hypothetical protein